MVVTHSQSKDFRELRSRLARRDVVVNVAPPTGLDSNAMELHTLAPSSPSPQVSDYYPSWFDSYQTILARLENIDTNLLLLKERTEEPESFVFAEVGAKEKEIEKRAAKLEYDFQHTSSLISSLAPEQESPTRLRLIANVKTNLARKLKDLVFIFKRDQQVFLSDRAHRSKTLARVGGNNESDSDDERAFLFAPQPGEEGNALQLIHQESALLRERDDEVQRLSTSIADLQSLFGQLGAMVVDQGTALDRIDYNIVATSEHTSHAVEELEGAAESQGKKNKLMIGLLIALVVVVGIVLGVIFLRRK